MVMPFAKLWTMMRATGFCSAVGLRDDLHPQTAVHIMVSGRAGEMQIGYLEYSLEFTI